MPLDVDLNVEVDRDRPDAESDSTTKPLRAGRYGEAYVLNLFNSNHMLGDEGSYFVATNPTPGTPVSFVINTSVSETAGNLLYIKNNDSIGNGRAKRIYVDFIRLINGTAAAAATSSHYFIKVDRVDRYTTGGTQLTPSNSNTDQASSSVAQIFMGAITTATPSPSIRTLSRGVLRASIPLTLDETIFKFGGVEGAGSVSLSAAGAQRMTIPCPPVILGPQANMCLQVWNPGNSVTAPTYEIEIGIIER